MDNVVSTESRPPEAVSACKAVTTSLLLAVKMFSMYSPEHANCRNAVARLHNDLETFLRDYGELVLQVEKNRLLFDGEVVYQGAVKDGDIAFALFRDGMLDLTFQKGIEHEETEAFAKILDGYKTLSGDAEADIVTALWEARLPHIRYNAAEHILDSDSDADTMTEEERKKQILNPIQQQSMAPSTALNVRMIADGLLGSSQEMKDLAQIDFSSLALHEEEALKLRDMVGKEEERDTTGEIMEMMTDILRGPEDKALFEGILEYLEEQLAESLKQKDLGASFRILKRMRQIRKLSEEKRPWAFSLINEFFKRISNEDFLSPLAGILGAEDKYQIKKAGRVLLLLSPEAIGALASTLHGSSSLGQKVVLKAIVVLATKDIGTFEDFLETADGDTASRLVGLLRFIEGRKAVEILAKMTRHSSEGVRKEALKTIVERKLWIPERVMNLIDDESASIRDAFMRYLGARRNEAAAAKLVEYIKNHKFGRNKDKHLFACFKTLGRCATGESIPFLQETLLGGSWVSKCRSSVRRQGAAVALSEIGSDEGRRILKQAFSSWYPGIKSAARSVMKEHRGPGEGK